MKDKLLSDPWMLRPDATGHYPHLTKDKPCWHGILWLPTGAALSVGIQRTAYGLFIGVEKQGACVLTYPVNMEYLSQRLELRGMTDSTREALTNFINDQLKNVDDEPGMPGDAANSDYAEAMEVQSEGRLKA